jgi:hypothetical protein
MIFVIQRPLGHKLSDTELQGSLTDFVGKVAVTTGFSHGLETGQYIFIQSNVSEYNGYKYITVSNATQFTFADNGPTIDGSVLNVDWVQDAIITYQVSVYDHGVNAVHNPIVYEMYSNVYPTNSQGEIYYPASVVSQSNENGYTRLELSGNIINSDTFLYDAYALSYITIGEDGPYQIITKISDSIVVINHAYDAAKVWSGPVIKYFTNYSINVNVWAGYESTHPSYSSKPFELAATLQFIPDSGGVIKFSISEILKSYITTRNKLDLGTLPNNTDFSVQFYIEYFESYDQSNGLEITTFADSPTSDQSEFQGLAINAMMPFKSIDAGAMSEQVYGFSASYLAKWLSLQEEITWIVDKFMDLSFILNDYGMYDSLDLWINGQLSEVMPNPGDGVIRIPLTFDAAGEYCVQMYRPGIPADPGFGIDLNSFINCNGGTWTLGATPTVTLPLITDSGYASQPFPSFAGATYTITYQIEILASAGSPIVQIRIALMNDDCDVVAYDSDLYVSAGVKVDVMNITPTTNATRIGVYINNLTLTNSKTIELQGLTFDGATAVSSIPITEEMCITVVEECDTTFIPENNIRLLEDGSFRLLE